MRSSFRQLLLTHLRHHANLTNIRLSVPLITTDPVRDLRIPRSYSTKQNTIVKDEKQDGVPKEQSQEPSVPDPSQHLEKIELDPEVEARMKYFQQKSKARKEVLRMDPEDFEGTAVGEKRKVSSLLELREGNYGPSGFKHLRFRKDEDMKYNFTDQLAFMHADIDLRWESLKRWWAGIEDKDQIRLQRYNPKRNEVLGNDLAAAHFVVFRKGKVKFFGHDQWVSEYRKDAAPEKDEDDLPAMQFELCALPTTYDPRYLVEAVDLSNFPIRYEGLENLKGLRYLKSLKLQNCHHIEAWCIDRLACYMGDRLEHLDLSGCQGLTEGALCAISRFRNLKTLIVHNLPQIRNMDVVCAILEEANPNLTIIGADYERKLEEVRKENDRLNKEARELEESTITVEPKHGPGPDPITERDSHEHLVETVK